MMSSAMKARDSFVRLREVVGQTIVLKWVFYVFGVLTAITFAVGTVAGFAVQVQAPGSAIDCGVPFEVVDGDFASGFPDELKKDCEDAAARWRRRALSVFFAFFAPTFLAGAVLTRRRVWSDNRSGGLRVLPRKKLRE